MVYWILHKDKNGSYLGTFNHHLPPIKISDSEIELVQLRNSDHSSEIAKTVMNSRSKLFWLYFTLWWLCINKLMNSYWPLPTASSESIITNQSRRGLIIWWNSVVSLLGLTSYKHLLDSIIRSNPDNHLKTM